MKKRLLALLCALVLTLGAVPLAAALEGEAARAADTLATLGLVNGSGSGYDLDAPATRAQAAVLLVRLAGAEEAAAADPWFAGFRDVPAWARTAVDYAAHQGWVSGVTAVEFQPDRAVSANAWCAFLLRMLGYSDKAGDFTVDGAAVFARRIGLTAAVYSGDLTRGALFQIMRDALTFSYKDGGTVIGRLVETGACSAAAANALGLLTPELTARQAADRSMAAVFQLQSFESQADMEAQKPHADATGFFISADGLAVTNYHSIDGELYAAATLSTGEVYPVESVVWYDADIDLAVLRVSRTSAAGKTSAAFHFLELAGTEDLRPGDRVYTLSNPLGLGLAVSEGVVSATDRAVDRYALPCVMFTAPISQGSSGGALVNVYGHVVAVTSGAYTYGNSMFLAVPADPLLTADLTGEGQTLAQVRAAQKDAA